jgi:hypothetical protein
VIEENIHDLLPLANCHLLFFLFSLHTYYPASQSAIEIEENIDYLLQLPSSCLLPAP